MKNSLSFDHLVIVVPNLNEAIHQFTGLGFTVTPGGVHAGGITHNALISFADGSYLELLAPRRRSTVRYFRFLHRLGLLRKHPAFQTPISQRFTLNLLLGPGLNDYALLASDLDDYIETAHQRGLFVEGIFPGGRLRPDGQQVSWRTAIPLGSELPFLIDDVTPRERRVPSGATQQHPNQVYGVAAIVVFIADLSTSLDDYKDLLGNDYDEEIHIHIPALISYGFPLGTTIIALANMPDYIYSPYRQYLAGRAARPLALHLRTSITPAAPSFSLIYDSQTGPKLTPLPS